MPTGKLCIRLTSMKVVFLLMILFSVQCVPTNINNNDSSGGKSVTTKEVDIKGKVYGFVPIFSVKNIVEPSPPAGENLGYIPILTFKEDDSTRVAPK